MDVSGQKTIYLWGLPRSLSTAVLRAMVTVDGCLGVFEPYLNAYYREKGKSLDGSPINIGDTFPEVKRRLQEGFPGYKVVFIKGIGNHFMGGQLDDHTFIPKDCTHTFIIRHPVKTLNSHIKTMVKAIEDMTQDEARRKEAIENVLSVDFIRPEQSYEYMVKIFDIVTNINKQKPIVMDADDLQRNPEGTLRAYCREVGIKYKDCMVHWGPITPEQKKMFPLLEKHPGFEPYFGRAINNEEFAQSEPSAAIITDVDEKYRDFIRENIVMYENLKRHKLSPI